MNQLQHQGHTLSAQGLHGVFLDQKMPASLAAGNAYGPATVQIAVVNDGMVPWPAGAVRLETRGFDWDATPLELTESVLPNKQASFGLTIRAPDAVGTYLFTWQLVTDTGRELLAAPTPPLTIDVISSCHELAAANRADDAELQQLRLEVTHLQSELAAAHGHDRTGELREQIAGAKSRIAELKASLEARKQTMHDVGCG